MPLKRFVDYAMEKDIAYFSLNLTLDRCPECGYEGIIGDECPVCHVKESEVHFNRIRRVNIVAPILKWFSVENSLNCWKSVKNN